MTQRFSIFIAVVFLLMGFSPGLAEEINILYTGDTHAMLYTCSCPIEKDGGLARRASLIRELKAGNPNTLVLDCGSFFAGGIMDEYAPNNELDKKRTLINLEGLKLMQYDALAISDDEFNFGQKFLQDIIASSKLKFISSNLKIDKLAPFVIREIAGIKFGIIGLTPMTTLPKALGLNSLEYNTAVKQALEGLKKQGADIIILLSRLGPQENLDLIKQAPGIDILIGGYRQTEKQSFDKIGSTLILRSAWQGRKLGKASFSIKDRKIINYKVEELRLSDKIPDSKEILEILPQCFSDNNCKKDSLSGFCQNPGKPDATCIFTKPNKVTLLVISSKECLTCAPEKGVERLKKIFPGIEASYLWHPASSQAADLIKKLGIRGLPVYLLAKEAELDSAFDKFKTNTVNRGDYYLVKPEFIGITYFLDNKKEKGKLDVFMSLYSQDAVNLLETIKEFNPAIHFLAIEKENKFMAKMGRPEVEEYLRAVCVQKYYPQRFRDYITCRAGNIDSSWWDNCLSNLDINKIKSCATGEEGRRLLKENIRLNQELGVMAGPTFISNNQEIFASNGIPSKEELKKVISK